QELTTKPTIAVFKRAPPLRAWNRKKNSSGWNSTLSPADYADLIQGLRRGSRCNADFMIMLGLSVVVASMGLVQNSPAVVIGSMLLAPLMTPMLGCGLALAQANPKLGNTSLMTVWVGLLGVLVISFILGILTPGSELTPEILARGKPTVLDLIVALASASAAAYALARPNLVGSIAGVAIATALVPPLCSAGLSLAYQSYANAQGAALLFITNFVAIVLCAAVTFRLMGVTSTRANARQRKWVFRTVSVLATTVVFLCVPLHYALMKHLVDAKPQSMTYPLATTVMDALEQRLSKENDVELISAGTPSSPNDSTDVILILGTLRDLDQKISKELTEIVHREMLDDELVVEIHCIRELWKETSK
ncbi:MAG: TIGR00341 family protein, partial [Gimesia sp.]|nr:TIGR00341 family protein [Gimesia sp.]